MSIVADLVDAVLRRRPRLLGRLLGESYIEKLPPEAQRAVKRYIEGMAKALGVSPEDIDERVALTWYKNRLRSLVKSEAWGKYGLEEI